MKLDAINENVNKNLDAFNKNVDKRLGTVNENFAKLKTMMQSNLTFRSIPDPLITTSAAKQ